MGREDGLRRVEGSWEEVEELRPKSRWETLKKVRRGEKSWGWRGKWWKNWGRTFGKSCEKILKNWDDLRRVATGLEVVATTEKSAPRRKRISRTELRRCESSLHFIRFGSYHIPLFPAGKFPNPPRAGFNCIAAVCDTCCHAKSKLTGSYSLRLAITDTKRSTVERSLGKICVSWTTCSHVQVTIWKQQSSMGLYGTRSIFVFIARLMTPWRPTHKGCVSCC